ncbi:DUF2937 family protein [Salipiger mucosus]|uniref:Methyl-accepting chemotaxis protein n=1 Tax=Salipiger mucosus DSM 16094 TaxID=1123237 RepID=S9QZX8_9RHOB|nr:DUF2937 family protein [Salipiger mucosus]EPX85137.1 Methyl-accepting chemotaxis protein [Salipiger mucosus DSM 16094]
MIVRALALAAGLTGAAGLSQFPEFSQQYVQRLGGAVDELSRVVARFERDAADLGLAPGEALRQLGSGGDFGARQADGLRETIARHERLSADLAALRGAGPLDRARLALHMDDREILDRAWDDFRPAVPVTLDGAMFAGAGFLGGWLLTGVLLSVLGALLRGGGGRKRKGRRGMRVEPPLSASPHRPQRNSAQ